MAKTQAQIQADIAAIEEQLNSGVTSVTVDGTTTQISLDHLRKRLQDLRSQLRSDQMKRPRASSVYLGGF